MHDSVPPRHSSTASASHPRASDTPAIQVTSPVPTSMGSPIAFRQYVEQHKAYAEHTRQAHDQERELWHLERMQLLERIKELEQAVKLLGGNVEDPLRSMEQHGAHGRPALAVQARAGNGDATGSEFWRGAGGIGLTHPTRAFSEPSNTAHASILRPHHLPSIHENHSPPKKSVGFDMTHTGSMEKDFHIHPIPSIPVTGDGSSFDSITFKSSVLSGGSTGHRSSGTQSPSPLHTPHNPPGQREPKPQMLDLPRSGLTSSDLLVKDAGHTPLARMTESISTSPTDTPKQDEPQPIPVERPARPPNERADSYFPEVENPLEPQPTKDDPALREPLALTTRPGDPENSEFLNALDSKLREVQHPDVASEASEASDTRQDIRGANGSGHAEGEQPLGSEELEPTLRIKSSTNFGTVFGATNVGKNL